METVYSGKVWKFGDKISTDFMVPGAKVLANPDISPEEAARFCMHANRPDWAGTVRPGDILVGGINFGCGSSRNGSAPLKTLGIRLRPRGVSLEDPPPQCREHGPPDAGRPRHHGFRGRGSATAR